MFRPVMSSAHRSSLVGAPVVAFLVAFLGSGLQASAHKNGVNTTSCIGCHTGGKSPTVTLTADVASPALGQMVTLTITVTQTNGPTAGFYLTSDFQTPGSFKAIEAGTTATTVGATHSMPRTGSGGITTFKVGWSSTVATGVELSVYALSANGDGTSKGDGAGEAHLALVTGCTGMTYYIDQDDDGYGTSDPRFESRKECAQPQGYSANIGDCDDFDEKVHPGAAEVCNGVDDNCDGMVDEGTGLQLCGSAAQTCVRGACSPPGPAGGTGNSGSGGSGASGSGGRSGGLGTGGSPGRDAGSEPGAGTGGMAPGAFGSGGAASIATGGSVGAGSGGKDAGLGPGPGATGGAAATGPTTPASGEGAESSVAGGCAVGPGNRGASHEGRWSLVPIASTLAAVAAGARRRRHSRRRRGR